MIHHEFWYREAAGLSSEISSLVKRIEQQGDVGALEDLLKIHRRTGKWEPLQIPSESVPEAFSILEGEAQRLQDALSPQVFDLLRETSIRASKRPDLPMEWYRKWYEYMEKEEGQYGESELSLFFSLMFIPQSFNEVLEEKLGPPKGLDWQVLVNIGPWNEGDQEGTPLHYYVNIVRPLYEEARRWFDYRWRLDSGDLDRIDVMEREWKTKYLPILQRQIQEWVSQENDPYGTKRRPEAVEWRRENPGAWERMQGAYATLGKLLQDLNGALSAYRSTHPRWEETERLAREVHGLYYDLRGAMAEYARDGMLTFPFTDLYENLEQRVRDLQERFVRLAK